MLYRTSNPHGGDIYEEKTVLDYSSNTNPLGTPQGVLGAMSEALQNVHHYPDPYCRKLVRAIAAFEDMPREYILCGNGAAELIYAYSEAIGARLAAEVEPTFAEYALGLERTGCRVERYALHKDNDFDLDDGFLKFLAEHRPDAVFLCNPNNPTGRTVRPDVLERILDFCHRHNVHLFLDECFIDLSDNGVSMKGFLKAHPELFILKAFTKSYGMAGVRLGYCLCSDGELLEKMAKATQPWNVSMLAQAAGVAALREESFLMKAKELIPAERRWLKSQMETLGFWVCPSAANYLLLHGKPNLHTALRQYGIAIRNCDNYHGLGSGWYRIAVRLHYQNEQLIAAVRQVLGKEQ